MNTPVAKELSDETIFGRDQDRMYYCVREGFSFTCAKSEGFCTHLEVKSEMFNGQAIVDGWYNVNISLGCTFTLDANPAHALSVLQVNCATNRMN